MLAMHAKNTACGRTNSFDCNHFLLSVRNSVEGYIGLYIVQVNSNIKRFGMMKKSIRHRLRHRKCCVPQQPEVFQPRHEEEVSRIAGYCRLGSIIWLWLSSSQFFSPVLQAMPWLFSCPSCPFYQTAPQAFRSAVRRPTSWHRHHDVRPA